MLRKSPRFGQPVKVLAMTKRGLHPRNVLIEFSDGERTVTNYGCLRWKCEHLRP
jgi:hypothetical protein